MSEQKKMDAERAASCTKPDCFPYCDCGGVDDPAPAVKPEPASVEVLGKTCIDGGTCHHACTTRCFRRECCTHFSDYKGPWAYPKEEEAPLPVGVPDGWSITRDGDSLIVRRDHGTAVELNHDGTLGERVIYGFIDDMLATALAAPTVKAEQVPTPEFVWVRLLDALAGDNGCSFTASTDDYREACQPLVELIAAGFFRDSADSLDGDIWMVAAGEQGEAAARFASCADAYAVLSVVLNRVFDRPEDAPSLPAAGSAVEEVEVVGYRFFHVDHGYIFRRTHIYEGNPSLEAHSLMTVAQHERIVAALSAQQSAPEPSLEHAGKLLVSAEPLRQVLNALVNAPHMIRELQATREPVALFADNPINVLIAEFNAAHGGDK